MPVSIEKSTRLVFAARTRTLVGSSVRICGGTHRVDAWSEADAVRPVTPGRDARDAGAPAREDQDSAGQRLGAGLLGDAYRRYRANGDDPEEAAVGGRRARRDGERARRCAKPPA